MDIAFAGAVYQQLSVIVIVKNKLIVIVNNK